MLNILSFSEEVLKTVVIEEGESIIAEAERNPPAPNTIGFSQIVDVIKMWLGQKASRQDRVLAFLVTFPQFAITAVMNFIKNKVGVKTGETSRDLTLERVRPAVESVLLYSKQTLFETDKASDSEMVPAQMGALHNILNCFEILARGEFETILTAGTNIGKAVKVRFGTVLGSYTDRIDAIEVRILNDREQHRTSAKPTNGKTNGHSVTHSEPVPANFGEKLSTALRIKSDTLATEQTQATADQPFAGPAPVPPTLVVEADADSDAIMKAEMARLGGLSPEALDAAKVGADGGVTMQTTETQVLLQEMVHEAVTEEQTVRVEEYLADVPVDGAPAVPTTAPELAMSASV